MKKTILSKALLILFVTLFHHTQIVAQKNLNDIICIKNGKVTISEVITIDGAAKEDLYMGGVIAINKLFSKDAIKTQDNNNHLISVVGRLTDKSLMHQRYNLNIQFKDGKYKYEISDIYYIPQGAAAKVVSTTSIEGYGIISRNPDWRKVVYEDYSKIIATLKKEIKGNISEW